MTNEPTSLVYCKKCFSTNLRPNASFLDTGVCIACHYHSLRGDKFNVEYDRRLNLLTQWLAELKRRRGRKRIHKVYDCVVGVSGGKDSTRQAEWVKKHLRMNPLLVCGAYPPLQSTHIGANNLSNLISKGYDIEVHTPSPKSAARLSLDSLKEFGNVSKAAEMALFSIVPRIALSKRIPLIFWGENPATQLGDSSVLGENELDGNQLRHLNTLKEGGLGWIQDSVGPNRTEFYRYPSFDSTNSAVDIIYLGPVWGDWTNYFNSGYAALNGLQLRPFDSKETGDLSGASMLDEDFTNINQMIKYYKFGFGRATEFVNQNIRNGTISRENGVQMVVDFDGVCSDEIIDRYCNYVAVSVKDFWSITNRFVNRKIFAVKPHSRPTPLFQPGTDYKW